MKPEIPDILAIIAGNGVYPVLLAQSARQNGIRRIVVLAFKGETERAIVKYADEVKWLRLGCLTDFLEAVRNSGARHAVMAGQITPTALFHVRPDSAAMALLAKLEKRNAETIFGAIGDEIRKLGVELLPASAFMESHMPPAGTLSARAPDDREKADIALGFNVAKVTSGLDIGQTVVVKEGTIIAVEAFEGTNATIRRTLDLCGPGAVIVKTAKRGHDMRFDIPVIGMNTMKLLRKVRASALAVEANRTIILEKDKVTAEANRMNMCLVAHACD